MLMQIPKASPISWPINHLLIATCLQINNVFLPIPNMSLPISAKTNIEYPLPGMNVARVKMICPMSQIMENIKNEVQRPILSIK